MNDLNSLEERIRHLELELKRVSNPAKIYKPTNADKNDRLISTMESRIKQLELSLARVAQPRDYTPIASADLRNAKTSSLKTIERGGVWSDWTPTCDGMSSYDAQLGRYCIIGKLCILAFQITGTSNSNTLHVAGLPYNVGDDDNQSRYFPVASFINNGTDYYATTSHTVSGQFRSNGNTGGFGNEIWFWYDGSATGWATSNLKGIDVAFAVYETT